MLPVKTPFGLFQQHRPIADVALLVTTLLLARTFAVGVRFTFD
jgi:hypothetical protein